MACVLCLLAWLPEDTELELDASDPAVWHARLPAPAHAPVAPALFDPRDIENLALASGWRLERQPQCWSLHLPATATKDSA